MKTTKKGFVQVPETTLNALKNMLFANEGGVDLSNIINDLTLSEETADLMAINIALVHKGIKPQIDTCPRFEYNYSNKYFVYQFKHFSLISGTITAERTTFAYEENNHNFCPLVSETINMGYESWINLNTNEAEAQSKCIKTK